ncbi:MAG: hypothetical protein R3C14_32755 [Caldilineaceae bacterium]
MNIIIAIIVIIFQFIVAQFLGFGVAMATGVGNGWELVVLPLGNALGVWGVGALAAWLRGQLVARAYGQRLIGTLIGSAAGVGLILLTPPFGFAQLLFPLGGAFLGYYLAAYRSLR